jgi:uncharacterized protein (TIGR02118 family)
MIKFVALYRVPDDPERFDESYFASHLPLIAKTPGLERTEVGRVVRMMAGEPSYYLMAEMYFADKDVLRAALKSPEWAASGANLASFGGLELATMFTVEPVDPATGRP